MASMSLLDHFSALDDPRQSGKVLYPLQEILLVVLCGTLAGAEDFVELRLWAKNHMDFLKRFYDFDHGIPAHDTLNDVMNALPKDLFTDCFTAWVATLRDNQTDVIAIDGKTSRRARAKDGRPLHMVSAWAARQRLVLGQEEAGVKENEITAIPRLLAKLELKGALVTIDAMGCQREIAQAILDGGGDYLLGLKANWPRLMDETISAFDAAPADTLDTHQTVDADHGRIETRTHAVLHDVGWMGSDRKEPDHREMPGAAMVGRIQSHVEKNGQVSVFTRYFISSMPMNAQDFAIAARAHWGIESRLHWVLDVVFHDDLMRLRTANGPANMATIKHCCMNIVHAITDKNSLKSRRKALGWNQDYLEAALKGALKAAAT
jgi:predicted transposase YbfD/YdcC